MGTGCVIPRCPASGPRVPPEHPPKEGVPPSAPRSRQAHQSAARREELTNALKRKSLPIPPKREPHPMHQVEVKPTRCTKEGTSSPIPPRSYHSIISFLLDYHVAINLNITEVSLCSKSCQILSKYQMLLRSAKENCLKITESDFTDWCEIIKFLEISFEDRV